MRCIWKYPLEVTDTQTVTMPAGVIRHVGVQHGVVCLWAEVTPGAGESDRTICIFGTGHPISLLSKEYIGSFELEGGDLVFHAYESKL